MKREFNKKEMKKNLRSYISWNNFMKNYEEFEGM